MLFKFITIVILPKLKLIKFCIALQVSIVAAHSGDFGTKVDVDSQDTNLNLDL